MNLIASMITFLKSFSQAVCGAQLRLCVTLASEQSYMFYGRTYDFVSFFPHVYKSHKSIIYLAYMYLLLTCIYCLHVLLQQGGHWLVVYYSARNFRMHFEFWKLVVQFVSQIWVAPRRGRISVFFLQNFKTWSFPTFLQLRLAFKYT